MPGVTAETATAIVQPRGTLPSYVRLTREVYAAITGWPLNSGDSERCCKPCRLQLSSRCSEPAIEGSSDADATGSRVSLGRA